VLLPALAAVREAAWRTLGLRAYHGQIMGVLAMHGGNLAEMATGEGKTLTAGMTAVLLAWSGRPCHVITVNDYLVERDATWLGPFFGFCHLTHGHVLAPMSAAERREAYTRDITHGTSKEIVADFLRDRLRIDPRAATRHLLASLQSAPLPTPPQPVQRGLHAAIVDEADSVLIDEAVTPLILSAPRANPALREAVIAAHRLVAPFAEGRHYRVDRRHRELDLTPEGMTLMDDSAASLPGVWKSPRRRRELVQQALVAREFHQAGRQYIVVDGRIVIVDEFTGRPMPQRTWRQGIHQAVEAKENLVPGDPGETLARLSFQRYFRMYPRLTGMTGTAAEAADEFWKVYRLPVVRIPPHRSCIRRVAPDRMLPDSRSRWEAVVAEIQRVHARGQPVLVGTRSVEASEELARHLAQHGVHHFQILNAVRHHEEARIIAMAGEAGRITLATNMAGRGTDIRLGPGVAELGGLHVIATERHESGRVDRQLFGRCARQGDPGSAVAMMSVEDDLFRRHLPAGVWRQLRRAVGQGGVVPALAGWAVHWAQRRAQTQAGRQRLSVLRQDEWVDEALSFAGSGVGPSS
jgi:preprotein translocase subunit SecA